MVKKLLVASLLCNSLNWKTIIFVIVVHRKGVRLPVDNFLGFKRAILDPFRLGGDGSLLFFAHKNFVR